MSTRNIRAHQSRGLIPEPERRGRFAYYGPAHERALLQIKELQAEGYNLTAIEQMLRADRDRDADLRRLVLAPLLEDEEVVLTHPQMAAMFGLTPDVARLRVGLRSGLLRDLGGGEYAAPSRRLLDATSALVRDGMSILDVYEMQVQIATATREVARRFVEACLRAAGGLGDEALLPEHEDEVRRRFEHLRDQFTMVLAATFAVNVRRASEAVAARDGVATAAPSGSTRRA
jgi:DNA-binding transcriptional MerR regulator